MKLILYVKVFGYDDVEKARRIARQLGVAVPNSKVDSKSVEKAARILSALHLELDKQIAERLVDALQQVGIKPRVAYGMRYSREDILSSPLIKVSGTLDLPYADIDRDARYNGAIGGCGQCKSLADLRGPFVFKNAPQSEWRIATTATSEWLVSKCLAQSLRDVPGVAGQLMTLQNPGRWIGWELIVVKSTLPPIDPSTTGYIFDKQCSVCKRDGFGTDNDRDVPVLRYRADDLRAISPINGTYELAGTSRLERDRILSLAKPILLVSPDVARILLDQAAKDVRLDPVELV